MIYGLGVLKAKWNWFLCTDQRLYIYIINATKQLRSCQPISHQELLAWITNLPFCLLHYGCFHNQKRKQFFFNY